MLGDKIHVQHKVQSDYSDDQLLFLKQMGVNYVYAMFKDEHTDYESVMSFTERLRRFGFIITDGGNTNIYKSPDIHLGLSGRDKAIERYNDFNRILGKARIPISYMTWEPNQVLTSRFGVGKYTRNAVGRIVDIDELRTHPYSHERLYTKEEMWENFQYWWERVLPVCEETGIKIALHPNDPPVDCLLGISNLITSSVDYLHAFELTGNSPYLGMKMCMGCWLEGGEAFGNLMEDIDYFVKNGKVFIVHFRNVSSSGPYFEETLLEDGYMNMYHVMRRLVENDYDGTIHVDHVPEYVSSCGGIESSNAYSIGYMKALLNCSIEEVSKKVKHAEKL